jgi:hypothetical protein
MYIHTTHKQTCNQNTYMYTRMALLQTYVHTTHKTPYMYTHMALLLTLTYLKHKRTHTDVCTHSCLAQSQQECGQLLWLQATSTEGQSLLQGVCVRVRVYARVCKCVCVYMCVRACVYVCTSVCILRVYARVCMCVHVCACLYVDMNARTKTPCPVLFKKSRQQTRIERAAQKFTCPHTSSRQPSNMSCTCFSNSDSLLWRRSLTIPDTKMAPYP